METRLSIRLKDLRKKHNMTSTFIIKKLKQYKLNYTVSSVYKWENGNAVPGVEVLTALSKIYKCNFSYLVSEEEAFYKILTTEEKLLLNYFRTDFLFRSTTVQIMRIIF